MIIAKNYLAHIELVSKNEKNYGQTISFYASQNSFMNLMTKIENTVKEEFQDMKVLKIHLLTEGLR